jgi:hypothetical protein
MGVFVLLRDCPLHCRGRRAEITDSSDYHVLAGRNPAKPVASSSNIALTPVARYPPQVAASQHLRTAPLAALVLRDFPEIPIATGILT